MNTKCSLAWGDKFHVYTDCDEKHAFVHLEISDAEFDASPGQVTVRIPVPLWEHIRAYSPARYNLADLADAKLHQLAKKRAAESKKILRAAKPNSLYRALIAFSPPASVRQMLGRLKADRKAQQKLRSDVERLRKQNEPKTKIRQRQGGVPLGRQTPNKPSQKHAKPS